MNSKVAQATTTSRSNRRGEMPKCASRDLAQLIAPSFPRSNNCDPGRFFKKGWRPREDSNLRFRKPLLYPAELRGHAIAIVYPNWRPAQRSKALPGRERLPAPATLFI